MEFSTAEPRHHINNGTNTINPPTNSPLLLSFIETYVLVRVVLFSAIIALGAVLNSLVIFTVLRWPNMRTSCNFFLMNIAIADLFVALIAAPLRIAELYFGWPLGEIMCYLLVPLQDVFVIVSVVTHTAIALERQRVIISPFKPKLTLRSTTIIISTIWVCTYLASALPYAVNLKIRTDSSGLTYCYPVWSSHLYRRVYSIYLVVVFIVAPLVVQASSYYRLLSCLKNKPIVRSESANYNMQVERRTKRLLKTLITLVVVFQVCYIPRGVMMLLFEFNALPLHSLTTLYADLIAIILFYVKHTVNPIILFTFSSEFRSHYSIRNCWSERKRRGKVAGATTDTNGKPISL